MSAAERACLQHQAGRLTALERLRVVLDEDSFEPLPEGDRPQALAGRGRINGRPLCIFVQQGGDDSGLRERLLQQAGQNAVPLIMIHDPGAAPLWPQSVVSCLDAQALLHGKVPCLAVVLGECHGYHALVAAMADWIFMARPGTLLSLSPETHVHAVRHEMPGPPLLGEADVNARSGGVHVVGRHEIDTLLSVRRFFDLLPLHAGALLPCLPEDDPVTRQEPGLDTLVPTHGDMSYDMRELVDTLVDDERFFELLPEYGTSVLSGLARLGGRPLGVLASQPEVLAGCVDHAAAEKMLSLVRFCAAHGLPVVMLVDLPGPVPGVDQHYARLALTMAQWLHAWHRSRSPRIVVFTRTPACSLPLLSADAVLVWGERHEARAAGVPVDRLIRPADTRAALAEVLAALCNDDSRMADPV